jgi:hypothetical protein
MLSSKSYKNLKKDKKIIDKGNFWWNQTKVSVNPTERAWMYEFYYFKKIDSLFEIENSKAHAFFVEENNKGESANLRRNGKLNRCLMLENTNFWVFVIINLYKVSIFIRNENFIETETFVEKDRNIYDLNFLISKRTRRRLTSLMRKSWSCRRSV